MGFPAVFANEASVAASTAEIGAEGPSDASAAALRASASAWKRTWSSMNELTKKYEWSKPGCLRTETFWPTAAAASSSSSGFNCVWRNWSSRPTSTSTSSNCGNADPRLRSKAHGSCSLPLVAASAPKYASNAFSPQGTAVGATMGANALTEAYASGFLKAMASAPMPPMECPAMLLSDVTEKFCSMSFGSSCVT
jgi:hypothetical protein